MLDMTELTAGIERIWQFTPSADRVADFADFPTFQQAYAAAAVAPEAETAREVVQLFQIYLGRVPAEGGLNDWTDAQLRTDPEPLTLGQTARAFAKSAEFIAFTEDKTTYDIVQGLAVNQLGRELDPSTGAAFFTDRTDARIAELTPTFGAAAAREIAFKELGLSFFFSNEFQDRSEAPVTNFLTQTGLDMIPDGDLFELSGSFVPVVEQVDTAQWTVRLNSAEGAEALAFPLEVTGSETGPDSLSFFGDADVRLDLTDPFEQLEGIDIDGSGDIEFDEQDFDFRSQVGVQFFEVFIAHPQSNEALLNPDFTDSGFTGDLTIDGTAWDGDGRSTNGNIVLGGWGADTIFTGRGNDFASGHALDDTFKLGANADFVFIELTTIDERFSGDDGEVDGGSTFDTSPTQDNDWLLLEASDDEEPVTVALTGTLPTFSDPDLGTLAGLIEELIGALGVEGEIDPFVGNEDFGSIQTRLGNDGNSIQNIENVNASGNFYKFLDIETDETVIEGGRPIAFYGAGEFTDPATGLNTVDEFYGATREVVFNLADGSQLDITTALIDGFDIADVDQAVIDEINMMFADFDVDNDGTAEGIDTSDDGNAGVDSFSEFFILAYSLFDGEDGIEVFPGTDLNPGTNTAGEAIDPLNSGANGPIVIVEDTTEGRGFESFIPASDPSAAVQFRVAADEDGVEREGRGFAPLAEDEDIPGNRVLPDLFFGDNRDFSPELEEYRVPNMSPGVTAQMIITGTNPGADQNLGAQEIGMNTIIAGYDNDYVDGLGGDDLLFGGDLEYLMTHRHNPNLFSIGSGTISVNGQDGVADTGRDSLIGGAGDDNLIWDAAAGDFIGSLASIGAGEEDPKDVFAGYGHDTLWITTFSAGRTTSTGDTPSTDGSEERFVANGAERDVIGFAEEEDEEAAAETVTTDGVFRFDLGAGWGQDFQGNGPDTRLDGTPSGIDLAGADRANNADQTNYADGFAATTVTNIESVNASGYGAIDYKAAGTNDPELNFENQQNYRGANTPLDLRGIDTDLQSLAPGGAGEDLVRNSDVNDHDYTLDQMLAFFNVFSVDEMGNPLSALVSSFSNDGGQTFARTAGDFTLPEGTADNLDPADYRLPDQLGDVVTPSENILWGGQGNDTIEGRGGDDWVAGYTGDDTFVVSTNDGDNVQDYLRFIVPVYDEFNGGSGSGVVNIGDLISFGSGGSGDAEARVVDVLDAFGNPFDIGAGLINQEAADAVLEDLSDGSGGASGAIDFLESDLTTPPVVDQQNDSDLEDLFEGDAEEGDNPFYIVVEALDFPDSGFAMKTLGNEYGSPPPQEAIRDFLGISQGDEVTLTEPGGSGTETGFKVNLLSPSEEDDPSQPGPRIVPLNQFGNTIFGDNVNIIARLSDELDGEGESNTDGVADSEGQIDGSESTRQVIKRDFRPGVTEEENVRIQRLDVTGDLNDPNGPDNWGPVTQILILDDTGAQVAGIAPIDVTGDTTASQVAATINTAIAGNPLLGELIVSVSAVASDDVDPMDEEFDPNNLDAVEFQFRAGVADELNIAVFDATVLGSGGAQGDRGVELRDLGLGTPEIMFVPEDDEIVFRSYQNRLDDESVPDQQASLGLEAYAEDLVVGVQDGTTKLVEGQKYNIFVDDLKDFDVFSMTINGETYTLTVGLDEVTNENITGETTEEFLERFADFVNSMIAMDPHTTDGTIEVMAFDPTNQDDPMLAQDMAANADDGENGHGLMIREATKGVDAAEHIFIQFPQIEIDNFNGDAPSVVVKEVSDTSVVIYDYDWRDATGTDGLNRGVPHTVYRDDPDTVTDLYQRPAPDNDDMFDDYSLDFDYQDRFITFEDSSGLNRSILQNAEANGSKVEGLDILTFDNEYEEVLDSHDNGFQAEIDLQYAIGTNDDAYLAPLSSSSPPLEVVGNGFGLIGNPATEVYAPIHGDDNLRGSAAIDEIYGYTGDDRIIGSRNFDDNFMEDPKFEIWDGGVDVHVGSNGKVLFDDTEPSGLAQSGGIEIKFKDALILKEGGLDDDEAYDENTRFVINVIAIAADGSIDANIFAFEDDGDSLYDHSAKALNFEVIRTLNDRANDQLSFEEYGENEGVGITWDNSSDMGFFNGEHLQVMGTETVTGTEFGDLIKGGSQPDTIFGLGGNDDIEGNDKDDTIDGGEGDNVIDGGSGDDSITAGAGNDAIYGGPGDDTISSGAGDDCVEGESGDDLITTGLGNDDIDGGTGVDTIDAGAGNDVVWDDDFEFDAITLGDGVDKLFVDLTDDGGDYFFDIDEVTDDNSTDYALVTDSVKDLGGMPSANGGVNRFIDPETDGIDDLLVLNQVAPFVSGGSGEDLVMKFIPNVEDRDTETLQLTFAVELDGNCAAGCEGDWKMFTVDLDDPIYQFGPNSDLTFEQAADTTIASDIADAVKDALNQFFLNPGNQANIDADLAAMLQGAFVATTTVDGKFVTLDATNDQSKILLLDAQFDGVEAGDTIGVRTTQANLDPTDKEDTDNITTDFTNGDLTDVDRFWFHGGDSNFSPDGIDPSTVWLGDGDNDGREFYINGSNPVPESSFDPSSDLIKEVVLYGGGTIDGQDYGEEIIGQGPGTTTVNPGAGTDHVRNAGTVNVGAPTQAMGSTGMLMFFGKQVLEEDSNLKIPGDDVDPNDDVTEFSQSTDGFLKFTWAVSPTDEAVRHNVDVFATTQGTDQLYEWRLFRVNEDGEVVGAVESGSSFPDDIHERLEIDELRQVNPDFQDGDQMMLIIAGSGTAADLDQLDIRSVKITATDDEGDPVSLTSLTGSYVENSTDINGNSGFDTLLGSEGNDDIMGAGGEDVIRGRGGDDTIDGGTDNDMIGGGAGNDGIVGGDGDDMVTGDGGDDTLEGNAGNDLLEGGDGNDQVFGGADDDTLSGGDGQDSLDAGEGEDVYVLTAPDGYDVPTGISPAPFGEPSGTNVNNSASGNVELNDHSRPGGPAPDVINLNIDDDTIDTDQITWRNGDFTTSKNWWGNDSTIEVDLEGGFTDAQLDAAVVANLPDATQPMNAWDIMFLVNSTATRYVAIYDFDQSITISQDDYIHYGSLEGVDDPADLDMLKSDLAAMFTSSLGGVSFDGS